MGFRAITRGPVDYLAENCLFIGGPGSSTVLIDSANDTQPSLPLPPPPLLPQHGGTCGETLINSPFN